ncbi:hypothetical protein Hamer_G024294 [Homarus americanus]|uniref:Uncharacterized protein n=1 Tax=Homarus americanus TaxID=6706 RepID=A0A8J5KBD3_HOMAM|nr:hypothetical protein Hamer_G018847 [Homarus americanus]KAG7175669.1 hypothetical protein Hamer_G024294 [Homarus americanus]
MSGTREGAALPMFHALTGCDTVSSFSGHGKKTAWAIWAVYPDLTEALLKLSAASKVILEDAMHIIERFVILLYDRISSCMDINKVRRKLFAKKNNVQLIPPTEAALEEHVKRAVMSGAKPWYHHHSCLHQPAGAGRRMQKACTRRFGRHYLRLPTPVMS